MKAIGARLPCALIAALGFLSGCHRVQAPADKVAGTYQAVAQKPLNGGEIDGVKAEAIKHLTLRLLKGGRWEVTIANRRWVGNWVLTGQEIAFESDEKTFRHPALKVLPDGTLLSVEATATATRVLYSKVHGTSGDGG